MDSWRLIFIDIDQSYNIPVADSAIQGYMVVRAPKGSTEAVYYPKGSTNQIKAMLGIPTADWPDIQDALDLNGQYGLWISAPPGSSEEYPSYFGGVYVTKKGLFPFYKVTDRTNPSFQVLISPENENESYIHDDVANSVINAQLRTDSTTGFDYIDITGVPDAILSSSVGINFNFWGNSNAPAAYSGAASYQLVLAGTKVQVVSPVDESVVTVGQIVGNEIKIFGTNESGGPTSFMYIDFEQLVSSATYKTTSGDWVSPADETTYKNLLHTALLATLRWIVDVTDITYMTIAQKTQTEKETLVTFSDIGYDKYAYDYALDAGMDEFYPVSSDIFPLQRPLPADVENASGLYVMFYSPSVTAQNPECTTGIYLSTGAGTPSKNVTSNYRNRYIRIKASLIRRLMDGTSNGRDIGIDPFVDQIYYVTSAGKLQLCATTASAVPAPGTITGGKARTASNYNQLTFSVVEDVYPGDATSGGSFTGSLSQTGTDGYGGNIYFPTVLPENAVSDVDVAVYNTFDNDVNPSGFFDGYRIIDPRIYDSLLGTQSPASVTTGSGTVPSIKGQRYVTSVVNALISEGSTGGVIDTRFTPLLINGWTEAAKATYEPIPVFVEPTGTEDLKEILYALRANTHKVATFVTARIIDPSEANDPDSIIVTGRLTGTAQLVNQALRRDTFTGAKYWTNLAGIYSAKLLRIIDGKMGGWAPMYTDIGGYGGQLAVSVDKMKYEFSPEQLKILDGKGLNPIILDPTYGVMVVSQKTTQDPDNLSDWSYLGHSMAFDLFKREVRDSVMIPQIGKPNDSYYQAMRQRQVEAILNRRISGPQPIWASGKVEVANVNTDDVKAQRKFAIRVTVKVNVFSELVELTFVNVAQTTQI